MDEVPRLARTILACSTFARFDLADECFLKVQDVGRVMKSEIVPLEAPQAVPYDWKWKV